MAATGAPSVRTCGTRSSLEGISIVPTPYPKEFRRGVVAVARQGDQSIAKGTRSFGISESCLSRWLRIADLEDAGLGPWSTRRARRRRRRRPTNWKPRTASCANGPSSRSRRTRSCDGRLA
jgi:hypothetical protein